jgi:ribonuclease HII
LELIMGDPSKSQTVSIIDEPQLLLTSNELVAGVDEVGRGALFGPVVAAAVILPLSALSQLQASGVKDSKQLSSKKRTELAQQIQAVARGWRIGYATVAEIEQINILQASLLAMKRAVLKLQPQPQLCLVDGRFTIPDTATPQQSLIKGDQRSVSIAAASIVAKVWRDELIIRWASQYPEYDLSRNKGYGTERHRLALKKHGCSPQHRRFFALCRGN